MDRPEPVLRVATPADAAAITALMKRSTAALFPRFYGERQTQSAIDLVADVDPKLLTDGTYFVLESGEEVVACGGWSRRDRLHTGSGQAGGEARAIDPASEPARIRAMFVHPEWTRRGLGRRMLEQAERAARDEGYTKMALMATRPGVLLYQAFGFVATGPEENVALSDGVELGCVPMERPIGPLNAAAQPVTAASSAPGHVPPRLRSARAR